MSERESKKPTAAVAPPDIQMHKPPSMLWFVIPLGLLMLFVLLSR